MFDLFEQRTASLREAMDNGKINAQELVRYFLRRIAQYDQKGPCLNAVISVNPEAEETAAKLDKELYKGDIRSRLHGIPVVVKDNYDTLDLPTTAGCASLRESRPSRDAPIVQKLREAGAIILAKTNLTEFARTGVTVGSLAGQTRNPYDLTRTPGGSSGGTGAALAANYAIAGLGTDTVNSIRSPASANSLAGLRPTTGLLSRTGIVPCSFTQDSGGPLARSVADLAELLEVCAGYDPADPMTARQYGRVPASYLPFLREEGLRGKRIGLIRNNFGEDSDVLNAMEQSMKVIQKLGGMLVDLKVETLTTSLVLAECDVQLYETKPSMDHYFGSVSGCPVKSLAELVQKGELHHSIVEDLRACAALDDPLNHPDYFRRLYAIEQKRTLVYQTMARHNLDALCYPHQQILVEPIVNQSQNGRNGILASAIGFPALTVPAGFSRPSADAPIGVPIGIEFMARPYREDTLFEIGWAFEQATNFRRPPHLDDE